MTGGPSVSRVTYFSMEVALQAAMPTYSGGLWQETHCGPSLTSGSRWSPSRCCTGRAISGSAWTKAVCRRG